MATLWTSSRTPELDAHTKQHGRGSTGLSVGCKSPSQRGFWPAEPCAATEHRTAGSARMSCPKPHRAAPAMAAMYMPGTWKAWRGGGNYHHMDRRNKYSCTITWGVPCTGKAAFLTAASTVGGLCRCHCPSVGLRGWQRPALGHQHLSP